MNAPPAYVIEAARLAALKSPCAKSKRGAALLNRELADMVFRVASHVPFDGLGVIAATGFNGPPEGLSSPGALCSGSDLCRRDCAKLCLHAEERAIRAAGALDDVADLELVHVKVVDGRVVPGGGPSCWQCSRLVAEVKLRGVWLFEHVECPSDTCPMCTGEECNLCGAGQVRDGARQLGAADGSRCDHAVEERHEGKQPPRGVWRFYTAQQFHAETLRNEQLGDRR
jgi:deoxycytidylate deaminase